MSGEERAIRWETGDESEELIYGMAATAARTASEMLATDVIVMDLRETVSYTDYFVVASAATERQTRRLAEEITDRMNEAGHRPHTRQGGQGTDWISLDFLDVVVHIFTDEARDYYRLESLWRGVPQESWSE